MTYRFPIGKPSDFFGDFYYVVNMIFPSKVLFSNLLGMEMMGLKVVGFPRKVFMD